MNNNILEMQFNMIRVGIEGIKDGKSKAERYLQAETLQKVLDNLQQNSSEMYNRGFTDAVK
jgi:hypothetical protein